MFGKEQPDVVTDKEVGDYVAALHKENAISEVITEVDDGTGLDFHSKKSTSGKEDKK